MLQHQTIHPFKNHIIRIDDARLFAGEHDYPEIADLKSYLASLFPDRVFHVENDMVHGLSGTIAEARFNGEICDL